MGRSTMKMLLGWLWALAILLTGVPALAQPQLDPARHPYLALVSTDRAVYRPGQSGAVKLSLRNTTGAALTGTAEIAIYRNTALVGFGSTPVTIPAGGALPVAIPFTAPTSNLRGYLVAATIRSGAGAVLDGAPGAIDVQSGFPTKFPRQCWVTGVGLAGDVPALMDSQVAWHCNTVQAYDVYYKPELAPPPALANWRALNNDPITRSAVTALVTQSHARAMPVLFFQATAEAYDTFLAQGTGPKVAWGSFRRACSTAAPCTAADMDRTPDAPDNWTQYGWQADHLVLFDTCNAAWRTHLLAKSIKPMLDQFGFDGWQADTLGAPVGQRYNAAGQKIDPGSCISTQTSAAQAALGKPVILNNVSGWHDRATALTGSQPYLYRETWNFDTTTFGGLDAIVNGSAAGLRRYSSRAIVQPAYLQRNRSDACGIGAITGTACQVNPVSAQLATAMYAVAGSTLMNHMDDRCMMTGVFVPGYHLPCAPATMDALLAYKAFEVAYQPMLRDGVAQSIEACTITSGAIGGTGGFANQVFALGKIKAGFQICQFVNLGSSNEWTDLNATMTPGTAWSNVAIKLYYAGSTVTPGTNKLWWASPQVENGRAQALSYTTGSDSGGNYVSATVPDLSYWTMVVLETAALADDDLHVNPREPVRGVAYNDAAAGVSPVNTVANNGCCGRWAAYRGMAFGSASPTTLNVLYGATGAGTLEFRLDSRSGPVISTCALPATGGLGTLVTRTCAVSGATGTRDLVVTFRDQPVALYSFVFG